MCTHLSSVKRMVLPEMLLVEYTIQNYEKIAAKNYYLKSPQTTVLGR